MRMKNIQTPLKTPPSRLPTAWVIKYHKIIFSIVVTKLNVNNIKIFVFFLLSYSVFDFIFSLFFVSGPCARLSWPSRQLLGALQSTVSYRITHDDSVICLLTEKTFRGTKYVRQLLLPLFWRHLYIRPIYCIVLPAWRIYFITTRSRV